MPLKFKIIIVVVFARCRIAFHIFGSIVFFLVFPPDTNYKFKCNSTTRDTT